MAAPNFITLKDGITYSKCYITPNQLKECLTPCTYCAFQVQKECDSCSPFCGNENTEVCFINLDKVDD